MSEKNIVVKIIGQSDMTAVNTDLQELQDRERDIRLEMLKQQAEYSKQVANIGATVKGREAQVAALDKLSAAQKKQQASLVEEQAKMKATLTDFTAKMGNVNDTVAKGAVQAPKFVTQLRAMKQELAKMESEGISPSSKAFVDLSIKAGELEDQIGDTRSRVKILASDTKYLDAAMGLGNGLAGGFTVATSAAALLGGENEELTKSFLVVQNVMQLMAGIQAVATALNKDEALSVVTGTAAEKSSMITKIKSTVSKYANIGATTLETAAENGSKVAKVGSTAAQWALNSAMLASPIFWIAAVVLAVVGAYALFSSSADDAKKRQDALNASLKSTEDDLKNTKESTDATVEYMKAAGKSKEDIRNYELTKAREANRKAIAENEKQRKAYNDASASEQKDMKENYDKSVVLVKTTGKDINSLKVKYQIEDRQAQTDSVKKQADIDKQSAEKAKENEKKRADEIKVAQKELADTVIALMADGKQKELDQIALNYERKMAAITGNSVAEIALRKNYELLKAKEVQTVTDKYANDGSKKEMELAVLKAQNAASGSVNDIALQQSVLSKKAELDKLEVNQSKDSAELKAEKVKAIELKLKADKEALLIGDAKKQLDISKTATDNLIKDEKYKAEMILASAESSGAEKADAREKLKQLEFDSIDAETKYYKAQLDNKIIDQTAYDAKMREMKDKKNADDIQTDKDVAAEKMAIQQALFDFGSMLVNGLFDMKKESLNQESADLEQQKQAELDAAGNNATAKEAIEKKFAAKQLEIKRQQAVADKEQALFNIAIGTAQNIIKAGLNPVLIGLAIASGLFQAGVVAAKPLPKYAKGRKGGRGEFATVGELGPETMWIPEGASIIPANRRLDNRTFNEFAIPQLRVPELPNIDSRFIEHSFSNKIDIDYNRLGKAVADNVKIPKYEQKHVTVNVDKSGIIVKDGNQTTHYLNRKYSAQWN
jgi:hypothetical protein